MVKKYVFEIAGREISIETGKVAEQAGAAVWVQSGETVVLVTATASEKPRDGIDFFPLSVDFEEKMYSVGKIPGGFIKREGRPSEKAILTSRLIDRPIRPLFPKDFYNDVHVMATVLSVDPDVSPDICAMIGSSAALSISDIPFAGPTGSVAVGLVGDELIINPTAAEREESSLNLVVSGTKDAVMMVEAGAKEISEETMLKAIMLAHEEIKKIAAEIEKMVEEIGKPKREYTHQVPREEIEADVREYAADKVLWSIDTFDRAEREARTAAVKQEVIEHFAEKYPDGAGDIDGVLYNMTKAAVRRRILDEGIRPDGRTLEQVRPIWCEVGVLPRPHGSGIFTRGQTQVMTVLTLGAKSDVQILDGIWDEDFKRYIHHYNMPSYSTGETRPSRTPGRREIGHGALAERALEPVIPPESEFPYAIRAVSEVLSSNGSTSQASVCGSTLALMDAGVPIKAPVSGVAMGLIKDPETGKVAILTDIQGLEDFYGDMDFKVAGTEEGITAIQMDIKIKGIDEPILREALEHAHKGRMHILGKMLEVIDKPRDHLSKYAPKIIGFSIDPEKIRDVIGTGGKVINKIIADTGVKIDIDDDGGVFITTPDEAAAAKARQIIEAIVSDVEVGAEFYGKVVRIMNFGAFVELAPGKDGLIHITKLSNERIDKVEDVVNIGDEVHVRVLEIDSQGRINLGIVGVEGRPTPPRREPQRRSGGFDRGPRHDNR